MTKNAWESDRHFSKRFAMIRVADDFSYRLGFRGISDRMHGKKEEYILDYLENLLLPVIEKYQKCGDVGVYVPNAPVWVCWWTGVESAPRLVQQCIRSIRSRAGQHPVNLITKENYNQFLDIPDFLLTRLERGQIGLAHFADYLRVSLLKQYGGLWLDATIFCAGEIPEKFFTIPFFTCKGPYRESRYLSHYQWVTFCLGGWKESVWYSFMKDALELYWIREEQAVDYLFFDSLIYLARERIPVIRKLMDAVPENTPHRDDLQAAMNEALPAEAFWNVVQGDTEIYKLSWRETYKQTTTEGEDTVYRYFLDLNNL